MLEKLGFRKKKNMKKPSIGIFSFTSCSGCQLEILDLEDVILQLTELVDIKYFPMAQEKNESENFDIIFIEGAVTNEEQVPKIKEIRGKAKYVVAIGSCAVYGGINAMRTFLPFDPVKRVYPIPVSQKALEPKPVDNYIKVDHYIRGCPIMKEEFVEVVKQLLKGVTPLVHEKPVCYECKQKQNRCLLIDGKICFGPITYAGCGALCPSISVDCTGCRGPVKDCHIDSFLDIVKKKGYQKEDIKRKLLHYASISDRLKLSKVKKKNVKN